MPAKLTRYVVGQDTERAFQHVLYNSTGARTRCRDRLTGLTEGDRRMLRRSMARMQRHRPSWRAQVPEALRVALRPADLGVGVVALARVSTVGRRR